MAVIDGYAFLTDTGIFFRLQASIFGAVSHAFYGAANDACKYPRCRV